MTDAGLPFEQVHIEATIARMSSLEVCKFAIACAEMLFVLDSKAREIADKPGSDVLRDVLDSAWKGVGGDTPPVFHHSRDELVALVPDEDEPGWSAARAVVASATSAVVYAVGTFDVGGALADARSAAYQVYDVGEFYLQHRASNFLDFSDWANDPVIARSLRWIQSALAGAVSLSTEQLRSDAMEEGVGFSAMFTDL